MAKSLRSKWKRKCRAIKRERYGKKELERLKKTLGINEEQATVKDKDMTEISKIANVITAKKTIPAKEVDENQMDTTDPNKRIFNPKTLKDQHGTYPIWVHPRKIMKKKTKSNKKGKTVKKRN